jgi:hypothetical protein
MRKLSLLLILAGAAYATTPSISSCSISLESKSVAVSPNPTSGQGLLVIVDATYFQNVLALPTDTLGTVFQPIVVGLNPNPNMVSYWGIALSSGADTVTTTNGEGISVILISNPASVRAVDGALGSSTNNSTGGIGPLGNINSNDLIVSTVVGPSSTTWTAGASYTIASGCQATDGNGSVAFEYQSVSSVGTYAGAFGTSANYPYMQVFAISGSSSPLFIANGTAVNWSNPTTWGFASGSAVCGTNVPCNGDVVSIQNGTTLTADQNLSGSGQMIIGTSPSSQYPPAIQGNDTGQLVIPIGTVLVRRGWVAFTGNVYATEPAIITNSGSEIVDSSLVSPTSTSYGIYASTGTYQGGAVYRPYVFAGSSTSMALWNSAAGGANGTFFTSTVGAQHNQVYGSYFSIQNCGSSTVPCSYGTPATAITWSHFLVSQSGRFDWWAGGSQNSQQFSFSYGRFKRSLDLVDLKNDTATGTILASVAFEAQYNGIENGGSQAGIESNPNYNNVYFGGGTLSSFANLTICTVNYVVNRMRVIGGNSGSYGLCENGESINNVYFWDFKADNPHSVQLSGTTPYTQSGNIFESPEDPTTDSGEAFTVLNPSSTTLYTLTNNVITSTKTGNSAMELTSGTVAYANSRFAIYHNSGFGGGASIGAFGFVDINEGGDSPAGSFIIKDNAMYNFLTYYKVRSINLTTTTADVCSVTDCDYNGGDGFTPTESACTGCTNQANGYAEKLSTTGIGSHDVNQSPYFADTWRLHATYDTRYLGNSVGTPWASGQNYVYGQIVSQVTSGVYNNQAINYFVTVAHTSSSSTQPETGANWRQYLEYAGTEDLEAEVAAGISAIANYETWVINGFTPQNPAFWLSGTDIGDGNPTIAPVNFSKQGPALLAATVI